LFAVHGSDGMEMECEGVEVSWRRKDQALPLCLIRWQ
jgi:hypothetical protein